MERKKVLFAVNLFLLAFLGIFGLFLQAKEEQKIMSVEVKTENELDRMKEGLISSDEPIGNFVLYGEHELPYDGNYGFYYISQSLNSEELKGKLETTDKKTESVFL